MKRELKRIGLSIETCDKGVRISLVDSTQGLLMSRNDALAVVRAIVAAAVGRK